MSSSSFELVIVSMSFVLLGLFLVAVWKRERGRGARERFVDDLHNSLGHRLGCDDMQKSVLRSSPTCGIDMGDVNAGEVCVDGKCISPAILTKIGGLTERLEQIERRLGALTE
jgi:hypothetical protein